MPTYIVKEHIRRSLDGRETTVKEHPVAKNPTAEDELLELRCRSCGVFMGYRRATGRFIFWCSEDCADTPMAKFEDSQIRDEMIVELHLKGLGIMEISRSLGDWPYQYIQQTLSRRGLNTSRSRAS